MSQTADPGDNFSSRDRNWNELLQELRVTQTGLVLMGNQCARGGLVLSAVALSGVVWLIFDFVVGRTAGVVAGAVAFAVFALVWIGVPLATRRHAVLAGTPPRRSRDDERTVSR